MWLYLGIVLLILLFTALIWFVSPQLSPIPYFPTLEPDMNRIGKALNLQPGSVLYDLGAGNGKIVFRFASASIKTVAVENNPFLVGIMLFKRIFHPHKQQITILCQDLFKTNLSEATHIYLFVGPFFINQIIKSISQQNHPKLKRIVSYRYQPQDKRFRKFDQQQIPIYVRDF